MTRAFSPTGASVGRASWADPALVACVVVLLAEAGLGAAPVYHESYDLVQINPSAIHALYQALCDDANRSLALSIEARHGEAIEAAQAFKEFVVQLSAFRDEIANKGLEAIILQEAYSTAPLAALSKSCQSAVEDHGALNESLTQVLDATGPSAGSWIWMLRAESHLGDMNASVSELESSVQSLPSFIDREHLLQRLAELRALLALYSSMLTDLEAGPPILLTLGLDRHTAYLGEDLQAWGVLSSGGDGVAGVEVLILNPSAVVSRGVTGLDGAYRATIHIPLLASEGMMQFRSRATFQGIQVESDASTVQILRIPTAVTLAASDDAVPPRGTVMLSGLLTDHYGRGIAGEEVTVQSGDGREWSTTTARGGHYSLSLTGPSDVDFVSLEARFAGNQMFQACSSAWVTIRIVQIPPPKAGTRLWLSANVTQVRPGQGVEFWGRLTAGEEIPLANQTVSLSFIGWHAATTDADGRYALRLTLPIDCPPGNYPAQAAYQSRLADLSSSVSNIVIITVLGGEADGYRVQTALDLLAQPDQLLPGGNLTFRGALFVAGGLGLPGEKVRIGFLSTVSTVQTSADGSFSDLWQVRGGLAPGIYPARAYFDSSPASNYSACSSNVVYVTVTGGTRMGTSLTLRSSDAETDLGQTLSLSGRLQDEWGRGVPGREVLIESEGSVTWARVRTDDEGYYLAWVIPPSAGTHLVHSTFRGDGFHLPCTSPPVSIDVLPPASGTEPLATQITVRAPPRIKAGDRLSITGVLSDTRGSGLHGKTVLILWDGLPAWSSMTEPEGSFGLNPLMSKDETGAHRLVAVFEPDGRIYSGSRSHEIRVEVWAPGVLWIPIMLSLVAIGMIVAGLAFARGVRPRMTQRHGAGSAEASLESVAEPAPGPMTPGHRAAGRTRRGPRTLQGMVGRGGQALLKAYAELVELISRVLLTDLADKTHTEILSLAGAGDMGQRVLERLRTVTQIYEKAAFSGHVTELAEEREFYRALGAIRSSLQEEGG